LISFGHCQKALGDDLNENVPISKDRGALRNKSLKLSTELTKNLKNSCAFFSRALIDAKENLRNNSFPAEESFRSNLDIGAVSSNNALLYQSRL
jgi:hypothetical protein